MRKIPVEAQRRRRLLAGLAALLLIPVVALGVMRLLFFSRSTGEDTGMGEETQLGAIGGRKNIYDRNFNELAVSFRLASIYARPLELKEPEQAAKVLAASLGVNEAELLTSLKAERSFVWVGRQIPEERVSKIAEANIKGVHVIQHSYRYYPLHEVASHVVGFVKDDQGLAGIESSYDNILRGGGAYDPTLSKAPVPPDVVSGKVGAHVVTTIDLRAQRELEAKLQHLIAESNARSGDAVLLLPASGEILALASVPEYDPNRFWAFTGDERKNRTIVEPVYPGGLRSFFWLAAALEKGNVPLAAAQPTADAEAPSPAPPLAIWNEVQDGVYLSPELMTLAAPAVPMPAEEKRLFAQRIGLCGESPIDLPEGAVAGGDEIALAGSNGQKALRGFPASCERIALGNGQAATNTVSLLSSFCWLFQSRPMAPHLLLGLSDGHQLWRVPPPAPPIKGLAQSVVNQLRGILAKEPSSGPGGLVVLESLVRQDLLTATEPAAPTAKAAPPQEQKQEPPAAQPVPPRYQSVLLAVTPEAQPAVAVAIVLNGAQLDLGKPSPARGAAKELAGQALHYAAEKITLPAWSTLAAQEAADYKKWLALHQEPEYQPMTAMVSTGGAMPDVKGLSLRKALQVLQPTGLRFKVVGSGQVVGQQPPPATPLKGLDKGLLELRMGQVQ